MPKTIETTHTKYFQNSTIHFLWSMQDSVTLLYRVDFQAQVPDWLPLSKDLVVILSGIVEMVGLDWLLGTNNIWLGISVVLVFPGNIAQYLDHKDAFGL
jgi:uncharacterized membrane protein